MVGALSLSLSRVYVCEYNEPIFCWILCGNMWGKIKENKYFEKSYWLWIFYYFSWLEIQLHITHFYRWESIKFYTEELSDSLTRLKLQDILFNKQDNSSNYNIKKIRKHTSKNNNFEGHCKIIQFIPTFLTSIMWYPHVALLMR